MCPSSQKLMASVQAALLFAVIASPQVFALMQQLLGGLFRVTTTGGVPTNAGLVLHAAVYGGIVYLLMLHKKKQQRVYGGNQSYSQGYGTGYGYGSGAYGYNGGYGGSY